VSFGDFNKYKKVYVNVQSCLFFGFSLKIKKNRCRHGLKFCDTIYVYYISLIARRRSHFDSMHSPCLSTKFDKAQVGLGQHVVRTMAS